MPRKNDISEEMKTKLEEVLRKSNAQKKILKKILTQLTEPKAESPRSDNADQ